MPTETLQIPTPDGPAALAELAATRVYFGHAETDITPEALADLDELLTTAGIDHISEIHPGTVHGFTMADTEAFSPAALQHHWTRLLTLLNRSLPGD